MMKAVGGEVGAASALAPKVGPLGLVYQLFFIYFSHQRKSVKIFKKPPWNGKD